MQTLCTHGWIAYIKTFENYYTMVHVAPTVEMFPVMSNSNVKDEGKCALMKIHKN